MVLSFIISALIGVFLVAESIFCQKILMRPYGLDLRAYSFLPVILTYLRKRNRIHSIICYPRIFSCDSIFFYPSTSSKQIFCHSERSEESLANARPT